MFADRLPALTDDYYIFTVDIFPQYQTSPYMDTTNTANDFVGSPIFSILMVLAVTGIGVALRMTFQSTNKEYVHRQDD